MSNLAQGLSGSGDDKAIARVIASGTLTEVKCDEKTIP
jgi:hypothetical protein